MVTFCESITVGVPPLLSTGDRVITADEIDDESVNAAAPVPLLGGAKFVFPALLEAPVGGPPKPANGAKG
jgi:hypothetical protein